MVEITILDWINGLLSLITVIIVSIIGLVMIAKYKKYKVKTLIFMGFAQIFIISPWQGSSGEFLYLIITGNLLPSAVYIFLICYLAPLAGLSITAGFTEMKFRNKQKLLVGIFIILGIIMETYIIYFLIVDANVLGRRFGPFDFEYSGFMRYYIIFLIVYVTLIGLFMGITGLNSDNPEIRWKGRFLILAFISWSLAAIADAVIETNLATVFFVRILLISSAIEMYCGFILPDWLKHKLIKTK